MKRFNVSKGGSARSFRGQVSKTKLLNVMQVHRGGIRL